MTLKIESLVDIIALLELALSNQKERVSAIKAVQNCIWDTETPISGATTEQWENLNDLALDLDYYEPNPVYRLGDPSFYGDQRLEVEIVETLRKLREVAPSSSNGGDDEA